MLRTDALGLEWDDIVPALVLTEDGGHYHHLRTGKIFSRQSIDAMGLQFAEGELGSECPEVEPQPQPKRKRAPVSEPVE